MRRYTMREASEVGKVASEHVSRYFTSLPETHSFDSVEKIPAWQDRDVDFLWNRKGRAIATKVEVKGDRHYGTGNYFLETSSNEGKGTAGCFLYTHADLVAYYFVPQWELHLLPMPASKEWFVAQMGRFEEKKTSTATDGSGSYVTVGRIVPRAIMHAEVGGIHVVDISKIVDAARG